MVRAVAQPYHGRLLILSIAEPPPPHDSPVAESLDPPNLEIANSSILPLVAPENSAQELEDAVMEDDRGSKGTPMEEDQVSKGTATKEDLHNREPSISGSLVNSPSPAKRIPKQQSMNRPLRNSNPCTPKKSNQIRPSKSRITKCRRQQSHQADATGSRVDLDVLTSKSSVTEEDLLQVLLIRYQSEKQERERAKVSNF